MTDEMEIALYRVACSMLECEEYADLMDIEELCVPMSEYDEYEYDTLLRSLDFD